MRVARFGTLARMCREERHQRETARARRAAPRDINGSYASMERGCDCRSAALAGQADRLLLAVPYVGRVYASTTECTFEVKPETPERAEEYFEMTFRGKTFA